MHSWQSYNPLLFCCPALVIHDGKLHATGQTVLPSKFPARHRSTCCSIAQLRVTAIKFTSDNSLCRRSAAYLCKSK